MMVRMEPSALTKSDKLERVENMAEDVLPVEVLVVDVLSRHGSQPWLPHPLPSPSLYMFHASVQNYVS